MFIVGICIVILFPPHYHFAALLLWSTFSLFTYTWRERPSRHVRPPRLSEQEWVFREKRIDYRSASRYNVLRLTIIGRTEVGFLCNDCEYIYNKYILYFCWLFTLLTQLLSSVAQWCPARRLFFFFLGEKQRFFWHPHASGRFSFVTWFWGVIPLNLGIRLPLINN